MIETYRNPEELLIEDQEVARKKRRKNKGKDDLPEEEPLFKKTKRSGAADAADEADEAVEATSSEPPMTSAKVAKKAEPLVAEAAAAAAAAAASTELNQDEQTGHETTKKKKKKRKNKNALLSGNDCADQAASEEVSKVSQSSQSPQKTKHDKKTKNPAAFKKPREAAAASADFRSEMTDERLKAYGFNPKKVRNQIKYGKSSQSWLFILSCILNSFLIDDNNGIIKSKKKKERYLNTWKLADESGIFNSFY